MNIFYFNKISKLYIYSLVCIFSLVIGCSKEKSIDKGIITFTSGKVYLNSKRAKTGEFIYKNSTIRTEEKSLAVVQFQNHSLVTLRENTTVQVTEIFFHVEKKSDILLKQQIGTTFNRIAKNKANFKIRTPTAIAGVRGTAFSITTQLNSSTIRILRGKVSLRKTGRTIKKDEKPLAKEIIVSAGEKMVISDTIEDSKKNLSPKEKENLELMDKVAFLDNVEKKETVIQKSIQVVPAKLESKIIDKLEIDQIQLEEKQPEKIQKVIQKIKKKKKKILTLAELEQKYGMLSVIMTKDGKKITGAFKKKGVNMEIMTVSGKVIIPMTQVKNVQPLRQ